MSRFDRGAIQENAKRLPLTKGFGESAFKSLSPVFKQMKLRHWLPLLMLSWLALIAASALAHSADCVPSLESKSRVLVGCGFGYARIVSRIDKPASQLTRRERDKIQLGHASLKEGFYNLITGVDKIDSMNGFPDSFVAKIAFAGFPYTAFVEFADSYSATSFVADIRAGGKSVDLSNCSNEVAGLVCPKSEAAPQTFSELDFNGYTVRIWDNNYAYDVRGRRLMTVAEMAAQRQKEEAMDAPVSSEEARSPASSRKPKTQVVQPSSEEDVGRVAPGAPLGL
jgi:hypothetical protein